MTLAQKRIFALLLLMAAAAFLLFGLPNAVASQNLAMVQMFEPDEAAPLPYVLRMIAPAPSMDAALRQFVFYEYYFYGFPYFALSALVLLPVQWLGQINNMPLVMLVLRQMISVLPMLAALLLLVYLQDGFRTYRSPLLFAFLVSVPAVLGNNFWWHPDGMVFLMAVLVIYCLRRDNLRFGRWFLAAAALCGVMTAAKLIGVYFFLAVGATLAAGFILKTASLKKLALMALAYLLVMALSFVAANPFLLSHWARDAYIATFIKQSDLLSLGYGIVYEKGLAAAWPLMHQYYGEAIFLVAALFAALWGLWRGPRRELNGLILAWFLPVSIVILWVTHFKYQYWLPVALPLFSCLVILLPEKWPFQWAAINKMLFWRINPQQRLQSLPSEAQDHPAQAGFAIFAAVSTARHGLANRLPLWVTRLPQLALLLIVAIQFSLYLAGDVPALIGRTQRADNNPRIQFYDQILAELKPLPPGPRFVYYDYRLYLPEKEGWTAETNYELLNYEYIRQKDFDVLLLLRQRIRDYLNPNATGIDPAAFAVSQQFYRDADAGAIQGYRLLYRDLQGLVFAREDIYAKYFIP